jgi:hypothetical protein
LEEDLLIASKAVELLHEKGHIDNDDTPAKSWARYIQGTRFQNMNTIIWSEVWDTEAAEAWSTLCMDYKYISLIAARICLSEEILATAESFMTIDKLVSTSPNFGDWQMESRDLEEATVAYYEGEKQRPLFPDFRRHYGIIKKVLTWAESAKDNIDSMQLNCFIRMFLQGLSISTEEAYESWVVDSHQQCLLLADYIKKTDNPTQLWDWLMEMIRQGDYFFHY